MTDIEQELKATVKRIRYLTNRIKAQLHEIMDLTLKCKLLLEDYRRESKSYFNRNVSRIFNLPIGTATRMRRSLAIVAKRQSIDRVTLEELNIIDKPMRKNNTTSKMDKPEILQLGELVGKIRHLNEKGLSEQNKAIANNMLIQLQQELSQ